MSSLWTLATHTAKSMNWRRVRARGCWFKNHTHCSAVYVQHRKKIAQHFNRAKQSHQIPFTDSPWKIFVERVFSIYFVLFVFRCLSFSLSECAISMCLYNNHALPFATEMRNIFHSTFIWIDKRTASKMMKREEEEKNMPRNPKSSVQHLTKHV